MKRCTVTLDDSWSRRRQRCGKTWDQCQVLGIRVAEKIKEGKMNEEKLEPITAE